MNTLNKLCLLGLSASVIALTSCQQPAPTSPQANAPHTDTHKAKNVILFIGDGMGISTITAARIFDGQSKGMSGEDNKLSFEEFPQLALVKTYNLDAQVPDSAGTASAMNTGLKTQIGKISVQPDALYAGCADSTATPPTSMADMAETAGLSTGIVSTARLTHATPAAVYGHVMSRGWENDTKISTDGKEKGCIDLAQQLINYNTGDGLELALGGGLNNFISGGLGAQRKDGKDLTQAWKDKGENYTFIQDAAALRALSPQANDKILGLFSKSHMSFETDRDNAKEPSLSELTSFAVKNLEARGNGYFLMVEGGRIDHAHHATNAYRALSETQEFAKAVAAADALTNDEDTLILVTADHSHVFTMAGYPRIGNPILGLVHPAGGDEEHLSKAADGNPYTTLGYQNGPHIRDVILTDEMVQDKDYRQEVSVRRPSETHGGEDVALFAKGPGANQVHGVIDQAEIFGIMTHALGLEE
ncbi:MAG TPA: alkaline phosphatase [Hellea balneolensis]|uniref:Alkaline phosphatase n=1 Tax=Hellea balneolensis TaxID=287478 RepID=A0A7C3C266_9PROT|nr:alkaline phosphatase [Hellea balneolensis]